MDSKELKKLLPQSVYKDLVEYGALDFAIEAAELVKGDLAGKKRKYSAGYMMVATNLRSVLGRCSFEKLATSGMWALPVEATLKQYAPSHKVNAHFKAVTEKTEQALIQVFLFHQCCTFFEFSFENLCS